MKKCKRKWKKRVMLGALAAGGAYAVVKTRNAYQGIMKMVEETDDDERKIMEKFAKSYHYIGSAEEFTGAAVGAFCCSLHLEMQNARIEKDCEIELGCMMSSIVIFVPEKIHVVVDVKMTSGVTRWTMQNGLPQGAEGPTLRIHGVARMSSVLVQTLPPTTSEENAPAEAKEPEETKAPAEDLPSGGPITDDEPAENFDAVNDTVRVIKISDLDDEDEVEKSIEADDADVAQAEPEEDLTAEQPAEVAPEEISESVEEAEEEVASEIEEKASEIEDDLTAEQPVEVTPEEISESAKEDEDENAPEEEKAAEEALASELDEAFDDDFDEDDDFAGEDKRKRLSQDQIDAILDRLADEYEERGGEE